MNENITNIIPKKYSNRILAKQYPQWLISNYNFTSLKKLSSQYKGKYGILYCDELPSIELLLTNITIIPIDNNYDKIRKEIMGKKLYCYTIEELKTMIGHKDFYNIIGRDGYIIIVPETRLNDKVRNDICFEYYINDTFHV
jgi:hypothetical protein